MCQRQFVSFYFQPYVSVSSYIANRFSSNCSVQWQFYVVFTERRYACAVYAMAPCLSVRLSVTSRRSTKRLNTGSHKQHHTIAQGIQFSETKDLRESRPGSPPTRAANAGGVGQNRRLSTNTWLYLENGTRQTHSFYKSRIGSRMRSIEW